MANSGNRLKVMGCITELDVGGAERAFVRILAGLQDRRWDVEAVSIRDSGPLANQLQEHQIPVVALNCGGLWDFRAFWRLKRQVQSSRPDVVLSFLHQANLYARLAVPSGSRTIVASGIRVADRRRSVIWPDRWTAGRVDQYIGVSHEVMRRHADWCGLPAELCTSIRNGVDVPPAFAELSRSQDHVLFVGRLTDQKSPQTLLRAFSILSRSRPGLTLQFVGDGPLGPMLQQEAQKLQIDGFVEFLGQRSDVPRLMQQATILVLPSLWEGMPNVVLEALANGLPVLCSEIDGVRDIVTHKETGWLVDPGSVEKLATAMNDLMATPVLRSELAKSGQRLVTDEYRWEDVISNYDELLRRRVSQSQEQS